MHLRRNAVIVTVVVAAAIVVVIAGMTFMGVFGGEGPTKDDPAAYTMAFVQKAIERYEQDGRQATIDYHNDPGNRDGQWYAMTIDENGYTISHLNSEIRGGDPALRMDVIPIRFTYDTKEAPGTNSRGHHIEQIIPHGIHQI